jgi:Holliday junction resolvase
MSEKQIQSDIMLALSENGCMVFRNHTSGAWTGEVIRRIGRTVTLQYANFILAGLCVGSSDVIGVHKATGKFIAIEVKTKNGKTTKEQTNFLLQIKKAGGISGVARSVEDALKILEEQA